MLIATPIETNKQASNSINPNIDPFHLTLSRHGIELKRGQASTLQVNTGFLCNQTCRHCHLNAGPGNLENMTQSTVDTVMNYAERCRFKVIDITGGAPELNPHIREIIQRACRLAPRIMFRSSLSALNDGKRDDLMHLLKKNGVVIIASFPSINASQTDAQRGNGIFEISIGALKKLNSMGYGMDGSDLELNLVSNPSGVLLPPPQKETEKRFHNLLAEKWNIHFNHLFTFANVPLGRFRDWLIQSGNFAGYMKKLVSGFNSCSVPELMCRTLVSISWDGYLFDCDFNMAERLYAGGEKIHVSDMKDAPKAGGRIATADHCYTCAAGPGFT